jgi:AbrB family looped-hinge helix DNA binding protein
MTPPTVKIYGTACMNAKGQVVIPAEARSSLGLKPGMRFVVIKAPLGSAVIVVKVEEIEEHIKYLAKVPGKKTGK